MAKISADEQARRTDIRRQESINREEQRRARERARFEKRTGRSFYNPERGPGWTPADVIVPSSRLPKWSYYGMIKPHMYYLASRSGSGTFYNINRGIGGADWDGLAPSSYRTEWQDGDDYTIADVMTHAVSVSGALPAGVTYLEEINLLVWTAEYQSFRKLYDDDRELMRWVDDIS